MKRLMIILFFLLSPVLLMAQDKVVIETPYEEEVTLTIPEDYETLREYYIELAELYQETKYDLEQEIDNVDDLLNNVDHLIKINEEQTNTLTNVEDYLKSSGPPILTHSALVGIGIQFPTTQSIHIAYQLQILGNFSVQLQAQYPLGVGLLLGWEFN